MDGDIKKVYSVPPTESSQHKRINIFLNNKYVTFNTQTCEI